MKNLFKRITVALLVRADALVTKALMRFVPHVYTPTLESIISTFDVAAAQLAELEKRNKAAADAKLDEVRRLEDARNRLNAEAARASRIQTRLNELTK
jgi:hypothetical protein